MGYMQITLGLLEQKLLVGISFHLILHSLQIYVDNIILSKWN